MIEQTYFLDMIPGESTPPVVHVSQFDVNSRTLTFNLMKGGVAFVPDAGMSVTLDGMKPDNHVFSYPMTVNGSSVSIDVLTQMTVVSGHVRCEVSVSNQSGKIGSANFILAVEESPIDSGSISESDIPIFEDLKNQAQQAAADAEQSASDAEGFAEDAETAASSVLSIVATIESSTTASHAYSVGDYLVLNGQLYEVTTAISSGETLTVGTNISATTVGSELTALNSNLSNKTDYSQIAGNTDLNTLVKSGVYRSPNSVAGVGTLVNCPISTPFAMLVTGNGASTVGCIQTIFGEYRVYTRRGTTGGFGRWTSSVSGVEFEESNRKLAGSFAMIETSPATANHAVGDLIVYDNQLYEVTAAIATGETLTVDTNITATTVGDELTELNNGLTTVSDDFTAFKYTQIFSNTDLDTITTPGMYGCPSQAVASTLSNCPVSQAFSLLVIRKTSNTPNQIIFEESRIYVRTRVTSGWHQWYVIAGTAVS